MLVCNCSLEGTEACKNCLAYKSYYGITNSTDVSWPDYFFEDVFGLKRYNPDTHELVEKKDAKIKRLMNEIECKKSNIQLYEELIIQYQEKFSKDQKKLQELEKELKNLKEEKD